MVFPRVSGRILQSLEIYKNISVPRIRGGYKEDVFIWERVIWNHYIFFRRKLYYELSKY